ncbi:hypothetical protein BLS_000033 [Venturia inaequalis]|uniref:Uncharacterized protein n=1 Tax=Venturia inaequalis TaxID=5025 RepID=A0A8H3VDT3_VENIN|nr:hypothetical protein BLS_000033 [Venturia inaequalis]KAE9991457.1 hypothetical protein EG327_011619 [Venturia inaequalis]
MSIFGRRKGAKKPEEEEKKSPGVSPAVKKPLQSKYVHVPQHAAADSLSVITPSARPDMRELVRREMTTPGSNKPVRPTLKATKSWTSGDVSIASVMEKPLDKASARHSSRHSSYNSAHRRQPYRSNVSLARSPLSNTIVEEELSETTDESPTGSPSSSDDGLEAKNDQLKLDISSTKPSSIKSMPELVSEPLIENPTTLQPDPPKKDKVDSFVEMPIEQPPIAAISPSAQENVDESSPVTIKLSTPFSPDFDLERGIASKSPTIDVSIESPKDDWFAENSRVSRAFKTGFLDDSRVQQWKAEEDAKAPPVPEIPIEFSAMARNPVAETPSILESDASSLAPASQLDVPVDDSSMMESRASSIDLPPRSRRRSDISVSAPNSRSSSLVRSEQHEYIVRQANAYNTVLGHLYPGASMQSTTTSPEDSERGPHSFLQRVSSSLYRGSSDGIVHVSRYPSSRRASLSESSPTLDGNDHEDGYFPPHQDNENMKPPPIPLASKPRFVSTYVQPNQSPRANMQRSNNTDVYSHTSQASEWPYTNYSKQLSYARRESSDSYSRSSSTRRSSAMDDRITIAHMDSGYRQSRMDFPFNENADSRSQFSFADQRSRASSITHAYSTSDADSSYDPHRGRTYSISSDSQGHSGKGHKYTNSDLSIFFPSPPVIHDPHRKLTQMLGSEYNPRGSLSRERAPTRKFSRSESPMTRRVDYPPSPTLVPDSESGSVYEKGKKVLDMPRGPRKMRSTTFMGRLRRKRSTVGEI